MSFGGRPKMDLFGDAIASLTNDWLNKAVSGLIQGVTEAVKQVGVWWLNIPAPILEGAMGDSPAQRIMIFTHALVPIIGMLSLLFVLPKIALQRDRDSVLGGVFGFVRVIFFSGAGLGAIALLLQFGDVISPWLVQNISGGTFEDGIAQLTGGTSAVVSGESVGVLVCLVVLLPLALLGALLNMMFVVFSYGMIVVIAGMLPLAAAASFTEKGNHQLQKIIGWIIALVLFKPVAAIIYGTGIGMMRGITGGITGDQPGGQTVMQMLYGVVIIGAASFALPALLRIVAPAVAAGSRGGGAGELVMGAAFVATGAMTGGASAAVAGAGSAGAGAGTAGSGAAATGAGASGTAATAEEGAASASGSAKALESDSGSAAGSGGSSGSNPGGSGGGSKQLRGGPSTTGTGKSAGSNSDENEQSGQGGEGQQGSGNPPGSSGAATQPSTSSSSAAGAGEPAGAGTGQPGANTATGARSQTGDRRSARLQSGAQHLRSHVAGVENGIDAGEEL